MYISVFNMEINIFKKIISIEIGDRFRNFYVDVIQCQNSYGPFH